MWSNGFCFYIRNYSFVFRTLKMLVLLSFRLPIVTECEVLLVRVRNRLWSIFRFESLLFISIDWIIKWMFLQFASHVNVYSTVLVAWSFFMFVMFVYICSQLKIWLCGLGDRGRWRRGGEGRMIDVVYY